MLPAQEGLGEVVNGLSVDVEGFAESMAESFPVPRSFLSTEEADREIRQNMAFVLDLFDQMGVKATFFFLGRIAETAPEVVSQAALRGHEIACHGYQHSRVTDRGAFERDIAKAKRLLEDVAGVPVRGFRAPDFSITKQTLWAIDVLRELGFQYDSSIFPIGFHDVYGIGEWSPTILEVAPGFWEFPLATFAVLGRTLPVAGGGYFRLYPFWLTRHAIRRINRSGQPAMIYLHPYEIGPVAPRLPGLSLYRRFRH